MFKFSLSVLSLVGLLGAMAPAPAQAWWWQYPSKFAATKACEEWVSKGKFINYREIHRDGTVVEGTMASRECVGDGPGSGWRVGGHVYENIDNGAVTFYVRDYTAPDHGVSSWETLGFKSYAEQWIIKS